MHSAKALIYPLQCAVFSFCLLGFGALAPAAALRVTSTADSGEGSLRAALAEASGGDTVDCSGLSGTIMLTSGELLVDKGVTILGPGPALLAVNGNAASRLFHITTQLKATISGFTLTNGTVSGSYPAHVGGAIWNDHGTLTLSNCVVTGNNGGFGPGGAIFNDASSSSANLSILASTISNNQATNSGGGIYNYGYHGNASLVIQNTTISGNSAISSGTVGGAVWNDGNGGSAGISLAVSTITSNSAAQYGGAIYSSGASSGSGYVSINSSTLVGNSAAAGGGVFNNGVGGTATLVIGNTILKAGALGANLVNNGGSANSFGYNLSSDSGGGVLTKSTDLLNTDPMVGPLAENGGPTPTHALLWGSPAVDKGKAMGETTDQRGQPRPWDFSSLANANGGEGSDIGAFELNPRARLIAITAKAGGTFQIDGTGLSNFTYGIEAATNLNPPVIWTSAGSVLATNGGAFSFTDTSAPSFPLRFYRASVSP